jgi:hypothetical protein
MWTGNGKVRVDGSDKVNATSGVPEGSEGIIISTTFNMDSGKITWKIDGGEDINTVVYPKLNSGKWIFCVYLKKAT